MLSPITVLTTVVSKDAVPTALFEAAVIEPTLVPKIVFSKNEIFLS